MLSGYLHNITFGGRNAEQLGRKERNERLKDLSNKLSGQSGIDEVHADMQAKKIMDGTVKFSKLKKQFSGIEKQMNNLNNSKEGE